jgi:hypothetical protein
MHAVEGKHTKTEDVSANHASQRQSQRCCHHLWNMCQKTTALEQLEFPA